MQYYYQFKHENDRQLEKVLKLAKERLTKNVPVPKFHVNSSLEKQFVLFDEDFEKNA